MKVVFETEQQKKESLQSQAAAAKTASAAAEFNAGLAKSEQRLKGLNLVLLYYASGLKYLYEEAGSGQSDRSNLAVIDQKR